jgi:hypothetical protein
MNVTLPPNNKIAFSKSPNGAAILHNRPELRTMKSAAKRQSNRNKFGAYRGWNRDRKDEYRLKRWGSLSKVPKGF